MAATLTPVDPATQPYLSGRFAPVATEITAADLVVEGTIPTDLTGAYVRNGPNLEFTPLGSYTYPLEVDGMLHGVRLEGARPAPPTGGSAPRASAPRSGPGGPCSAGS